MTTQTHVHITVDASEIRLPDDQAFAYLSDQVALFGQGDTDLEQVRYLRGALSILVDQLAARESDLIAAVRNEAQDPSA